MNEFYKNRDWFCFECSKSIFPFMSLCEEDFSICCSKLNDSHNRKGIDIQTFSEKNIFYEINKTDDKPGDLDRFDPDKNCIFEDTCEYVTNISSNRPQQSEISIINFNIRSIKENFKHFTDLLSNSNTTFDVITLTETWMDNDSCPDDYTLTGYHPPIIQNREGRPRGGVLIYLKESFECFNVCKKLCYDDLYNNILTVKATKDKKCHYISVCYRSPSSENTNFMEKLEKVVCDIKNKNSIITGDFNYNLLNLQHHGETENFYNVMKSNSFRTVITKPTRVTDTSSTLV